MDGWMDGWMSYADSWEFQVTWMTCKTLRLFFFFHLLPF